MVLDRTAELRTAGINKMFDARLCAKTGQRSVGTPSSAHLPVADSAASIGGAPTSIKVGDIVQAEWENGHLYPATVVALEEGDTVTVRWKDNGLDSTIAAELVTLSPEVGESSLVIGSRGDIRNDGHSANGTAAQPPPQSSVTVSGVLLRELVRSGKLINSRESIWWNGDQKWYSGVVAATLAVGKFLVLYDDKELIMESVHSTVALHSADLISQPKAVSVKAGRAPVRPHSTKSLSEEKFWNIADLSLASSFFTDENEEVQMRKKTRQIRYTECKELSVWSTEMIPIVVKDAGEKGLGAFAKKKIRQGEFIGEFAGEVVRTVPCNF